MNDWDPIYEFLVRMIALSRFFRKHKVFSWEFYLKLKSVINVVIIICYFFMFPLNHYYIVHCFHLLIFINTWLLCLALAFKRLWEKLAFNVYYHLFRWIKNVENNDVDKKNNRDESHVNENNYIVIFRTIKEFRNIIMFFKRRFIFQIGRICVIFKWLWPRILVVWELHWLEIIYWIVWFLMLYGTTVIVLFPASYPYFVYFFMAIKSFFLMIGSFLMDIGHILHTILHNVGHAFYLLGVYIFWAGYFVMALIIYIFKWIYALILQLPDIFLGLFILILKIIAVPLIIWLIYKLIIYFYRRWKK